jgi:hypothetical protein
MGGMWHQNDNQCTTKAKCVSWWKAGMNDDNKLVICLASKRRILLILVGVTLYWSHQHMTKAKCIDSCKAGVMIGGKDKGVSSLGSRSSSSSSSSSKSKLLGGTLYQYHHCTTKMKYSSWWWWKAGVIGDNDNNQASGLITIMISSSNISSSSISCSSGNLMHVGRKRWHGKLQCYSVSDSRQWWKACVQKDDNQWANNRT